MSARVWSDIGSIPGIAILVARTSYNPSSDIQKPYGSCMRGVLSFPRHGIIFVGWPVVSIALLLTETSSHIYYLPFYFQAVKGTSAEGSGIRCIPYLVSITLASIVVGGAITFLGPYNPPMWVGVVIFTIGSAMIYST